MTTEGTIEAIDNDAEIVVSVKGARLSLPIELVPAGLTLGQKLWISCETEAPKAATPQAILNELLHPDDAQRTA